MTTPVEYYLSRISAPWRVIQNAYGAHRVFWRAFGLTEEQKPEHQPFRFRLQDSIDPRDEFVEYLVQSAQAPDWSEVLGIRADTKKVSFNAESGQAYHFRLLANISKQLTLPNGKTKRVSVNRPADIEQWLIQQGQRHGFEIVSLIFEKPECEAQQSFHKGTSHLAAADRPKHEFQLNKTRFDGQLAVKDPDLFRNAIMSGIGPKAAFGFGMLSVSR